MAYLKPDVYTTIRNIIILYHGETFFSEEEYQNFIRKERLDWILDDIEIHKNEHTITIDTLAEYDYPK